MRTRMALDLAPGMYLSARWAFIEAELIQMGERVWVLVGVPVANSLVTDRDCISRDSAIASDSIEISPCRVAQPEIFKVT